MSKIIAVDFDGTLCADEYPRIGQEKTDVIKRLKEEIGKGARVILWTCRKGERLREAVRWCDARGIKLEAINANLSEMIIRFGGDTRKIFADEYWDDKNITI